MTWDCICICVCVLCEFWTRLIRNLNKPTRPQGLVAGPLLLPRGEETERKFVRDSGLEVRTSFLHSKQRLWVGLILSPTSVSPNCPGQHRAQAIQKSLLPEEKDCFRNDPMDFVSAP